MDASRNQEILKQSKFEDKWKLIRVVYRTFYVGFPKKIPKLTGPTFRWIASQNHNQLSP